ncbi:MAG: hypothetical protein DRI69_03690 [Bacteroidetes bacterium]|nr:MAG: hypothetical protein DRI69_03690 [Bacteroidota bacterium]
MNLTRKIQIMVLVAGASIALLACGSKPEVVQRVHATPVNEASVNTDVNTSVDARSQVHEVVVNDVLHTEKYTYLDVTEDGKQFWVAVPRKEVEKGETYYYVGGLMKKNFKSREYDRVFETVYLVSDVRKDPIYTGSTTVAQALSNVGDEPDHVHDQDIVQSEEGISLEELFNNKEKYAGKEVEIRGKCVKINKQIMGRNWVHIQDGTGGEKPYDLTVTTSADVPVGTVVTFTGMIGLNVDFGAGYKYDIILEDAHVH